MKLIIIFLCAMSLNALEYTPKMVDIDKTKGYIAYKKGTKEKISGLLKIYHDDTKILKELIPLKNGLINGKYKSYYKSNKLKSEIDYKDSKRTGKHISYYENARRSYDADMYNEKREGRVKAWYKNGQLNYDILFKDNKPEGIVKIFMQDGEVESIEEYYNGKVIKQIQPKAIDNILLQTRALTTYGSGDNLYYVFISPICPACKDFLSEIEKFKNYATFYIYLIPLNPKNKKERKLLDVVYSQEFPQDRMKAILNIKNGSIDLSTDTSNQSPTVNTIEIAKAQQIQMNMGITRVPTFIDTKGFKYTKEELYKKYKISK